MEQQPRKVDFGVNLHKKKDRPKSAFLSWILNNTSASATTGSNDDDETKIVNNDECSNKLEIRDQCMMNSSFSTPTAVGSYTQLNNNYQDNNVKALPPLPPLHKFNYANKTPNIVIDHPISETKKAEDIQIPDRRQSHLYTPFHDSNHLSDDNENYAYKRRSYYVSNLAPIDASISNSSLSRSATWQPSSSSSAANNTNALLNDTPGNNGNSFLLPQTDIPARRTSRNYANNPEIQAKLDAMLNSDKALLLSTVIHNNNHIDPSTSNSNTIIYRRSTTPGNRMI